MIKVGVLGARGRMGSQVRAAVTGSIVVVQSKKGLALTLNESGLDLSTLAAGGSATATLSIGGFTATDAVTVKPGSKKTVLK